MIFIKDTAAEINALFGESPAGVAVVSVNDLRLEPDRAELELHLWCGSLCAVYLTYELVPSGDDWVVLGIVGPIAMS